MKVWYSILVFFLVLVGMHHTTTLAQNELAVTQPGWPVYSPILGTVWQTGEQVNITWDFSSIQDPEVNIYMYNAECLSAPCIALAPLLLGSSILNNGITTWQVPVVLTEFYLGSQYLKIVGVNTPDDFVTSQNFTVKEADSKASFDHPGQGSLWGGGQSYTIKWSGESALKASKLLLSPYYACLYSNPACALAEPAPQVVAENLLGKTELLWVVPGTSFQGDVRLSLVDSSGVVLATSPVFSIVKDISWPHQPKIIGKETLVALPGDYISEEYKIYGGVAPYTWNVVGALPIGIALEPGQIQCITAPCVSPQDSAKLLGGVQSIGTYAFVLHVTDDKGLATFFDVKLTVRPSSAMPSRVFPGQVVRAQDKAVRLIMDNGSYYTFPSMEDFLGKGYRLFHIEHFSTLDLSGLQEDSFYRPSGTTFRYEGEKTVYYLTREYCKQAYTSFALFLAWYVQLADIVVIPITEQFPVCEDNFVQLPELVAVKGKSKTVYIYELGKLRPVTSGTVFLKLGYSFSNILTLEDSELSRYPKGAEVR